MSGASYNINDPAFRGFTIDRDERPGIEIGAQAVERAVSIDRRNPEGDYHPKDATVGDVQPRLLWPNILTKRPIPSRAPAWAATVTAADKDPKPRVGAPNAGFASFQGANGADPFFFFGAHRGRPTGIAVTGSSTPLGIQPGAVSGGTVSSATKSGQVLSGGLGQPMHVRPIRDRGGAEDDRYEHIIAPDRPAWGSRHPKGWTGAMLCTSREEAQAEVFIPGAHGLVAGSHPDADPALTTAIVGTDPKTDRVDPERRALLGDFARVVKQPHGIPGANAVSWVLANAHQKNMVEAAGLVTDLDPDDGISTVARGSARPVVHGVVSSQRGGFLDVGPSNRRHSISADADGLRVNPAGLSTHALWRVPGSLNLDGHLVFGDRQKLGEVEAPNTVRAHIVWDETARGVEGRAPGAWIVQSEDVLETEGGPPPDGPGRVPTPDPGAPGGPGGGGGAPGGNGGINTPPRGTGKGERQPLPTPIPPPPSKKSDPILFPLGDGPDQRKRAPRVIGPTRLEDTNKAIGTTALETAFSSILFRPVGFGCGAEDLRNELRPSARARAERKRHPVVAKLTATWNKGGANCNRGEPSYTYRPGVAPYPGGTASGLLMGLPPEVGPQDYASGYAPGRVSRSSWTLSLLKGYCNFGSGIPNPTNGRTESGYTWGANASTGAMEFQERGSTGAVASTQTLPTRTGTLALAGESAGFAGIKFSNGTINRTLNAASFTLDSLADNLYTLCYDLATTGYASGWTLSGSTDPTLDCSAITANQLAKVVNYLAADLVAGGSFIPSDYTVTNRQHVFYLDCDSFTLNQLGYAIAALLNFLGA